MTEINLSDYLDKEYIDREINRTLYGESYDFELFQDAFGYDYEKYYLPFECSVPQGLTDYNSLIEFYINAISCIEYECGEIDEIKNGSNCENIYCYHGRKLIAEIVPITQYLEIYFQK